MKRTILSGELPVGSRLPPERVLATELGVNRTTLRAALRELSNAGLLAARQGSGHSVRDYVSGGGPELVPMLVELARGGNGLGSVVADLLCVRRQLAVGLIERLVERKPSHVELAPVRRAIDAFEAAVQREVHPTLRELCALDITVVRALAALTGSPVLILFINPIEVILASVPELVSAMYAAPIENIEAYRALVTTLAEGQDAASFVRDALTERDAATLSRLLVATRSREERTLLGGA